MITCQIHASGRDESDLIYAIKEALRKIKEGYRDGTDSNSDGEYYFQVNEEGEEEEE